jgi:hypothetical protein
MDLRIIFLQQSPLPLIYRYLYIKVNEIEIISFYRVRRKNKTTRGFRYQKVLQLFNKEIGRINTSE